MEILKNFGFDPVLVVAQIVNFLILIYILNRFVFKRVLDFLKAREEKIKSGLDAAQKGEEFLVKAKISQKEILVKAQEDGRQLLENLEKQGQEEVETLRESAKSEATRIIEEAKKRAEDEKVRLEKELSHKTMQVAVSIVERTLQKLLTTKDQRKIIGSLAKNIK